jgi:LytS/YehU family sensor histidine kinase
MLIIEKHILSESLHKQVPAFSLQLILENCVKHNQVSSENPLLIRIYQENDHELIIENQIQPKKSNTLSSGFGLESLKQKYALLGQENGLGIHKTDKIFQVRLKLLPI